MVAAAAALAAEAAAGRAAARVPDSSVEVRLVVLHSEVASAHVVAPCRHEATVAAAWAAVLRQTTGMVLAAAFRHLHRPPLLSRPWAAHAPAGRHSVCSRHPGQAASPVAVVPAHPRMWISVRVPCTEPTVLSKI